MKNIWSVVVVAAFAAACSSGTDTSPTPKSPDKPSAVISDASHLGSDPNANPEFFFLPPLVPNPSSSPNWNAGQQNVNLKPTVTICQLNLPNTAQESDVTYSTPCKTGGYSKTFGFNSDGVQYHPNFEPDWDNGMPEPGHYHATWVVPTDNAVFYRISIFVGSTRLGFADVETRSNGTQLQNVNTGQFVARQDGKNAPIRFRIENTALCPIPGDYTTPCTSATVDLTQGGTVATTVTNVPAGITIPPQGGPSKPVTFTVTPCGPSGLAVDLPVFGSCLSVTANPALTAALTNPALVFVCDYPPDVSMIPHEQSEMVELHARHSPTSAEALVGANGHCPVSSAQTGSVKQMLASLFKGDWKGARRELGNLIQPQPLMAMFLHAGGGGLTAFQSDFQFALPSKMDFDQGNGATAATGATIPASVKVTDLFGAPVANAKVHFTVLSGGGSVSAPVVLSDANGIALVQWTLGGTAGANTLKAFGVGIATAALHGPRGAGDFQPHTLPYGCASPPCSYPAQTFDPFIPKYHDFDGNLDALVPSPTNGTGGVALQTGSLVFTATTNQPVTVIDFGSTGFNYRAGLAYDGTNPRAGSGPGTGFTIPANWYTPAFTPPSGDWQTGPASFGSRFLGCAINSTQAAEVITDHFVTGWPINTDIAIRKNFTTAYPGKLTITVRIDNDTKIWLDGVEVTPNAPPTGNGGYDAASGWWFHTNCADDQNPVFVVTGVPAGTHLVAIRGHDFGGASYLDVKVDLAP